MTCRMFAFQVVVRAYIGLGVLLCSRDRVRYNSLRRVARAPEHPQALQVHLSRKTRLP